MQAEQDEECNPTSNVQQAKQLDVCSNASSDSIAQEESAAGSPPENCTPSSYSRSGTPDKKKPRRNPAVLIQWIEEHHGNPYPTKAEKQQLASLSGTTLRQLNDWFANARRNIKKHGYSSWRKKKSHPGVTNTNSSSSSGTGSTGTKHQIDLQPNIQFLHSRYSSSGTTFQTAALTHPDTTPRAAIHKSFISAPPKFSPMAATPFPRTFPSFYHPPGHYAWSGVQSPPTGYQAVQMSSCPYSSATINMGYVPPTTLATTAPPLTWNPVSLGADHWTTCISPPVVGHHAHQPYMEHRRKEIDPPHHS